MQHRRKISGRQRCAAEIDTAADSLDDVQREAARRRLEQVRVGLQERPAGDQRGEMGCVGEFERTYGQLGEQSGGPHPDSPAREFAVVINVVVA